MVGIVVWTDQMKTTASRFEGSRVRLSEMVIVMYFQMTAIKTESSLYVPKLIPVHQRMELCNLAANGSDAVKEFVIGQECFPVNELCTAKLNEKISLMSSEKIAEWRFHPQHLTICQNMNFWKEQRRHSRNLILPSSTVKTITVFNRCDAVAT
jgi:hypothetical protein